MTASIPSFNRKRFSNISIDNGNYRQLGVLNVSNIGDKLRMVWMNLPEVFKTSKDTLYIYAPLRVREMYEDWYATNFGSAQYNTKFEKKTVHGTEGKLVFAECPGMADLKHIIISHKNNMKVGLSLPDAFRVRIPDNPKLVQYFNKCFIGCQIENIEKELFFCASFTEKYEIPYFEIDKEEIDFGDVVEANDKTVEVEFKGYNLTTSATVAVTGTVFSTTLSTISAADGNAGKKIPVKYDPSAVGTHEGKLTILSVTDDIEIEIPLSGTCVEASE